MSQLLSSFYLDVEELLDDLRLHWEEKDDPFNPTAFSKVRNKSENLMCCCPFHHETNPSFGIRIDYPYGWNCFGCGTSGNLGQLVAHALDLKDELQGEQYILKNYLVTSISDRKPIDLESILDGSQNDRKVSLHEDEVKKYLQKRHSYIKRRGFSDRTLDKYEIGYDDQTKSITFPVRTSKGDIRFVKKRYVEQKGFLNASGIDKKDIIYGLYYVLQAPSQITEIYLNESETDTLAMYESRMVGGAILGRILFKEQVKELVKAGIRTVNLFFDNDKHGVSATINSYSLLSNLTPIRVNVVIYPGGHWGIDGTDDMPFKDANDLLLAKKMDEIKIVSFDEFLSALKYKDEFEMDLLFI